MQTIFPSWLKKRIFASNDLFMMKRLLSERGINTVCESSLCPNMTECFSRRHATFLILGSICTRSCGFCSVKKDTPRSVDSEEPERIADFVKLLNLKYVVITSVTRDDLKDGGAGQFVKVIEAIRSVSADSRIEILVPDFGGRRESVEKVLETKPAVFGHNIETVKRVYPVVRNGASYSGSLDLLKMAKDTAPRQLTKSSIMVGLGETEEEILDTMSDLRLAGCDILTIGQYLRPGKDNANIKRFVTPEEFERYKILGEEIGFKYVSCGPYVRSSYNAFEIYSRLRGKEPKETAHEGCVIAAIGRRC